ncbi:hypothetical protein BGX24_006604 [Mortierella sp. AD032]|nr:hypothetical protein BGX24_006604 [Mortierella sp. AD032]
MAILDFSKDSGKSIAIHFHTRELGPEGQPLYYHTPENPAVIKGHVEFRTVKETKGGDIDFTFEARAESKWTEQHGKATIAYHYIKKFQEQSWEIKLNRSNPKTISPGVTRYDFEVPLDAGLPSSIEGSRGWFHYRFKAHIKRSFPHRDMAAKELVWVYSSTLRAGEQHEPMIYKHIWNDVLPVTCTLPSDVLYQGQVVPLTVQFEPFLDNSIHRGQELIVASAFVKMKQYTRLTDPKMLNKERKDKKTVFSLPVTEDWPQTNNGFTKTIMVELPGAKQLACALDSPPVTKRHTLKLIMMVYTNVSGEKEAKELRVEMDVKITAPRPEHIRDMAPAHAAPPPYQSIDTDDEDDAMPPEFSRSSSGRQSHGDHPSDVKHPQGLF